MFLSEWRVVSQMALDTSRYFSLAINASRLSSPFTSWCVHWKSSGA